MCTCLQSILAGHDHLFAGFEPVRDDGLAAIELVERERPHFNGRIRFDDIGIQAVRTSLHGRRWNRQHLVQRVNQQPRVDELSGPQIPFCVRKRRLEPYRAGCLKDLIVENGDRSSVELGLQVT